jgi:hypothetical protein
MSFVESFVRRLIKWILRRELQIPIALLLPYSNLGLINKISLLD